jgi:hypothetical protein
MIQSILVRHDFNDKVIDQCKRRRSIDEKTVRLINYKVTPGKDDLTLQEITF